MIRRQFEVAVKHQLPDGNLMGCRQRRTLWKTTATAKSISEE